MSQTLVNFAQAVTLDSNGQATITFTDGGAVAGWAKSVLATAFAVASRIDFDGVLIDYCLDGTWETTGRPVALLGGVLTITYDGGPRCAGVTGTVTIGVSPV